MKKKVMTKFNKENILNHLWDRVQRLEKIWGFNPNNGWAQVADSDFHRAIAYGEYDGLKSTIDSINYNSL